MDTRQRILDLLERRKWPVWRLAQKSGINHSTIFNMIQRKNMPSLKTIEEVTAAFGISMRQFFAEKGDPALFTPQQEAVFFLYHDTSIPQRKAILHAMELLSEQNGIAKTNYKEIEFQEDHNMDAIARIKELMEERGWTLYRLSQESGRAITTLINLLHHSKQPAQKGSADPHYDKQRAFVLDLPCSLHKIYNQIFDHLFGKLHPAFIICTQMMSIL